jgi:hypothetical protein
LDTREGKDAGDPWVLRVFGREQQQRMERKGVTEKDESGSRDVDHQDELASDPIIWREAQSAHAHEQAAKTNEQTCTVHVQ